MDMANRTTTTVCKYARGYEGEMMSSWSARYPAPHGAITGSHHSLALCLPAIIPNTLPLCSKHWLSATQPTSRTVKWVTAVPNNRVGGTTCCSNGYNRTYSTIRCAVSLDSPGIFTKLPLNKLSLPFLNPNLTSWRGWCEHLAPVMMKLGTQIGTYR